MAIFRGIGGAGDSTTDATVTAVTEQATAAAASATAAASSATSASTSASAASTSATSAASSATSASSSASSASSSASSASSSASSASTSATAAAASETAASASATAAAASETAAATSETNAELAKTAAETAATTAQGAASSATTSANAASTSASSASSSASTASSAATSAAAAYDSFDDRYLGTKTSDPTVDNDGDALLTGALYFNSTVSELKVYNGTSWDSVTAAGFSVVNDTTPQLGGALDTNGNPINFGDSDKATFGDSEDLWLYHDGTTSYLYDRGTGNLRIITNSTVSIDGVSGGEFMATFVSNGAVSLYYDNSNKFQTTSTGINVNGNIAVSGTVDGRDVATDGTKLDGIESSATADQTAQEIATAIDADATAETTLKSALGLGTAAYTASTAYATAAQGSLADSATQPGDNVSDLTNDAGYLTGITSQSIKNLLDVYSTMAPTDGQLLTWDNANSRWDAQDAPVSLPSQTGNAGYLLTTDGTTASWTNTINGGTY